MSNKYTKSNKQYHIIQVKEKSWKMTYLAWRLQIWSSFYQPLSAYNSKIRLREQRELKNTIEFSNHNLRTNLNWKKVLKWNWEQVYALCL